MTSCNFCYKQNSTTAKDLSNEKESNELSNEQEISKCQGENDVDTDNSQCDLPQPSIRHRKVEEILRKRTKH